MKKLLYSAVALATLLLAGSCQQDGLDGTKGGNGVTFTVAAPGKVQTKAISDGLNVDQLIYEVWLTPALGDLTTTDAVRLYQSDPVEMKVEGGVNKATVTLDLVKDQNYTVLFWAQVDDADAYNTTDLTAVTYAKNSYMANDESLAAFYAVAYVSDSKHVTKAGEQTNGNVTLRRPFAQLNLGTLNTPTYYTVSLVNSEVVLSNVNTVFNVATSVASDPVQFTFNMAPVPSNPAILEVGPDDYEWAAMNYVFAGSNITVEYDIETSLNGSTNLVTVNHTVDNVPLKENHRTNIIGNLISSNLDYQIVVDEEFDGTYVGEPFVELPPFDESTNTYVISNPDQLLYVALGGNDFEGQVVELACDIDFEGEAWTPIGTFDKPFMGTFDGKGYTISNLTIYDPEYAGFISVAEEGSVIKNLTLENVTVTSDYSAAGVVGAAGGGVVIENVNVSGSVTATSYAAGIIFNAADVTIKDCVNNATVSSKRSAGVAAWITSSTIENVVNNGAITGSFGASGIANRFSGTMSGVVNNGDIEVVVDPGLQSVYNEPAAGMVSVQLGATTYEYCYNYGDVKTVKDDPNASAAGIVGQTSTLATLNYCANYGDITAEASYAAGIVYGMYAGAVKANYCYNEGAVAGADGAAGISPKPQFSGDSNASRCLNSGVVTSSAGTAYQVASVNAESYYYNSNGDLLSVADNSVVAAADALVVLNGGADNSFFTIESSKIVVK